MAKRSKENGDDTPGSEGTGSVQGYFRRIFQENPKLLKERSNEAIYQRWLADHPGHDEVPPRIRQNLSNLKSVMRKRVNRRKRMKAEETLAVAAGRPAANRRPSGLVNLESAIDEALILARQIGSPELDEIVRLLRSARNRVIIRIGEA